jgi:hypothetical protein
MTLTKLGTRKELNIATLNWLQACLCLLQILRWALFEAHLVQQKTFLELTVLWSSGDRLSSIFLLVRQPPQWAMASSFTRFLDHTQRLTTVGRTPLDEWSARRRDPYLTTDNTTNIHTPGGIRTHNLCRWAAANPCLRRRGHSDRFVQTLHDY